MVRGPVWGLRDLFRTSQATRWAILGKVWYLHLPWVCSMKRFGWFLPILTSFAVGEEILSCILLAASRGIPERKPCWRLGLFSMSIEIIGAGKYDDAGNHVQSNLHTQEMSRHMMLHWQDYIHKSVTPHNVRLTRDVTLDDVTHTHTRDVKLHEVRFRRDVTLHDLTYTQDVALHDVRWERERESLPESSTEAAQKDPAIRNKRFVSCDKTVTRRKDHSLQRKNLLWYICSLPQVSLLLSYHY